VLAIAGIIYRATRRRSGAASKAHTPNKPVIAPWQPAPAHPGDGYTPHSRPVAPWQPAASFAPPSPSATAWPPAPAAASPAPYAPAQHR